MYNYYKSLNKYRKVKIWERVGQELRYNRGRVGNIDRGRLVCGWIQSIYRLLGEVLRSRLTHFCAMDLSMVFGARPTGRILSMLTFESEENQTESR